jgi:hypothetical protein
MAFTPASPITGATATGYLTSPTYTIVSDTPPVANAKQYAVTVLGGTQTNVVVSSVARPFTITVFKPAILKQLPVVNPVTGVLPSVPKNVFRVLTRKGCLPLAGQAPVIVTYDTIVSVPAGVGDADPNNLAAGYSAHLGALWEQSNEFMDTFVNGVI